MRKITFYCDRCGKQIEKEVNNIGVRFLNTEGVEVDNEFGAELCADCYNEIEEMITFMMLNPTIHFDGGKQIEQEKPKKTHGGDKKSLKLDLGKMAALRNAGWSYDKIAQEMHCSAQTVSNHMDEAQEFLAKQNLKEDLKQALENDIQEA